MKQAVNILEVSFRIVGVSDEDMQAISTGISSLEKDKTINESMQKTLNTLAKLVGSQDIVAFIAGNRYKPFLDTRTEGKIIYNGAEKSLTIDFQGVAKEKETVESIGKKIDEEIHKGSFYVTIGEDVPVDYWYYSARGKGVQFRVRKAHYSDIKPDTFGFRNVPIEKVLVCVDTESEGNLIHVDHVLSDKVKVDVSIGKELRVRINDVVVGDKWYVGKDAEYTVVDYNDLNYRTVYEGVDHYILKEDCTVI